MIAKVKEMNEMKLKVEGMHCGSCEALVKDELGEMAGVKAVEASHADGTVVVRYEGQLDPGRVKAAIEELGYRVNQ